MRNWKIGVSFNRFVNCTKAHGKMEVCDGCRPHMGVYHIEVRAGTTHAAMTVALFDWAVSSWASMGYEAVAVDVDPLSDELLPRPVASGTPQRRPARKATTAKKTSGARGQGGKGRRKA